MRHDGEGVVKVVSPALRRRLSTFGVTVGTLGGVAVIWEASVKIFDVPAFILPPIEDLVHEIVATPVYYASNALFTLSTTLAGFIGAAIIGVALAVAIVSSRLLERILLTLLAAMHSIPKVALAPLFVIWLGTGVEPKIAIAIMLAVFTIVVDTVVGMRSVDPDMLNMARAKRAGAVKILLKIQFPHALPNLFGALKTGISIALVGAIVGEFVAGQQGLGYVILVAQGNFDTARAFVAVVLLGIMGTILYYGIVAIEAKLLPWHVSQRGQPY